MAMTCPTLSMRGTCFYIMGLLSRTPSARAMLYDLGWRFSPNVDVGIVIPKDTQRFLSVKPCRFEGSWALNKRNRFGLEYVPIKNAPLPQTSLKSDYSNCKEVILGHMANLCNNVTIKPSLNALRVLKKDQRTRSYFTSTEMLLHAFRLINSYNFQLEARRCIFDELFNEVEFSKETLKVFDEPLSKPTVIRASGPIGKALSRKGSHKEKETSTIKNSKKSTSTVATKPKHRVVGFDFNETA
mmetsp:Transcript_34075/g.82532  ORF Transcript_34075/g.82532 Transcript_34075/m.82532 type:complete len:242 (+) Transcript_34075:1750-2475(+)